MSPCDTHWERLQSLSVRAKKREFLLTSFCSCFVVSAKDSHWGPRAKGVFHPPPLIAPVQKKNESNNRHGMLEDATRPGENEFAGSRPALPHCLVALDCCEADDTERSGLRESRDGNLPCRSACQVFRLSPARIGTSSRGSAGHCCWLFSTRQ